MCKLIKFKTDVYATNYGKKYYILKDQLGLLLWQYATESITQFVILLNGEIIQGSLYCKQEEIFEIVT